MPFLQRITACLRTLAQRHILLYIMRGNRDFALGEKFAKAASARYLDDPFVLEADQAFGHRIVLTHGDILCTADHGYQCLRRILRSRLVKRFLLSCPLTWREVLAKRLRGSNNHSVFLYNFRYDVTAHAVKKLFIHTRADMMIHGHTHRPGIHTHDENTRWVLPDWAFDEIENPSKRGGYLRLDASGLQAHTFPFESLKYSRD
jgi:UDP-2,3-diacylglucosamine hydrolase